MGLINFADVKALTVDGQNVTSIAIDGVAVWNKSALPQGYTLCKYIQNGPNDIDRAWNTYSHYNIDTGIKWNEANKIVTNIEVLTPSKNTANMFLVSKTEGTAPTSPWICLRSQKSGITPTIWTYENEVSIIEYVSSNANYITVGTWSDTTWSGIYRIESITIYNGESVLFDGVPCLDANNRACLYDLVGKTPHYNRGTDTYLYEVA